MNWQGVVGLAGLAVTVVLAALVLWENIPRQVKRSDDSRPALSADIPERVPVSDAELPATLDSLGFEVRVELTTFGPNQLPAVRVSRDEAAGLWWRLRQVVHATGRYPVIVLGSALGVLPDDEAPAAEVLARAAALDTAALQATLREQAGDAPRGPAMMDTDANPGLVVDLFGDETDIWVALLPTVRSWEAFAWVPSYAGINYGIGPAEHVALAKIIHGRWGAEVAELGSGTVQYRVTRPGETERAAFEMGRWLYAYCPDSIDQGVGTLEALVTVARHSPIWFFWWD